uniref:Lon proteolytic domain-containing protein n=1 Tax=Globodera rostochiensis TaxID=31243 RepID=A0A914I3E0_GLORO
MRFSVCAPPHDSLLDGPSVTAAAFIGLISVASNRRVQAAYAVTANVGESGRLQKIGGLQPKTKAAIAAGQTDICMPYGNRHQWAGTHQPGRVFGLCTTFAQQIETGYLIPMMASSNLRGPKLKLVGRFMRGSRRGLNNRCERLVWCAIFLKPPSSYGPPNCHRQCGRLRKISGLQAKTEAAIAAGKREVILPLGNKKD